MFDIYAQCTCNMCKTSHIEVVANNPTELLFNLNAECWFLIDEEPLCPLCAAELEVA